MASGKDSITPVSSWPFSLCSAGDTISLDSAITQYRLENGRRYHAYRDGNYWAPNDEKQNESLDIDHNTYLLALGGKLHLAPISKDIERAFDLGTGTGIWAIDFADEFPNTAVLGTDLSPIQPADVPPNCIFEVDDATDEWIYPPNYFDYVHIRNLYGSIDDWPTLYSRAYNHMKPGAYIEQFELSVEVKSDDGTVTDDGPLRKLNELCGVFIDAGEITGRTFEVAGAMKSNIEQAGFVNIVEKVFKVPLGGWPADPKLRELGLWALLGFDTGLEGYNFATLTRVMDWSPTEVYVLMAELRAAVRDPKIHSYYEIKVVYGQKPLPTA
ncbi:hypothetical protein OIDMADRAFT_102037 [Oidiodendron maius Zn]|uniref:Methyltransferase domain-containing protein n=1 Tax=Oidiodendron maius (strain Zn) TaxID=913774 RepID=A0A0C3HKA1_OIDMZ|nr:hypothetical protein OIDMADRAFT_102037 [Oidiodendron maius Zn]